MRLYVPHNVGKIRIDDFFLQNMLSLATLDYIFHKIDFLLAMRMEILACLTFEKANINLIN